MSDDHLDQALESDAPLSAAVHQRDIAHEAAEAQRQSEVVTLKPGAFAPATQ